MTSTTFDTLGYFEKLKAAGVPEAQAKVQVEVMQTVVRNYDETTCKELATKEDLNAVRLEMQAIKFDILKWMVGIAVGQLALLIAVLAIMK